MSRKQLNNPDVLRKRRKELKLTQHDLAKLSGVHPAVIANIEAGRRKLNGEVAEQLWEALRRKRDRPRVEREKIWQKAYEEALSKFKRCKRGSKRGE